MTKELSYISPEGYTVFTSQFLKNRGTCCRSACLHCPFGFTLKKHGLQFKDFSPQDEAHLEALREEAGSSVEWRTFSPENIKLLYLKDQACGFILKNHIVIKHLVLLPHFQHQGLTRELVESYFFI
jgi:hypothetical protein